MEQAWSKFCKDIKNKKGSMIIVPKNERAIREFHSETNKHEQKIHDAYHKARGYSIT